MNGLEKSFAINARRFCRVVLGKKDTFETTSANCTYFGQEASDVVKHGLQSDQPFAISRFGHSELRALLTYLHIHQASPSTKKLWDYIRGEKVEPWWHETTVRHITHNAGVFPTRIDVIEKFSELLLAEMRHIDVLGSWLGGEVWIKPMMPSTKFIRFHDFYHFLHPHPWTAALEGKKVLVVHPFSKSIQNQYALREKIFSGGHTLPLFDLITFTSVQSIAGNVPAGFGNWFEALDYMQDRISEIDFDIAILGCGAYGMPLATFIKRQLQKKAIHLGGNTQFLFGIKGSRWEQDPVFAPYINRYWVKPLPEETPEGHQTIDSNCYW